MANTDSYHSTSPQSSKNHDSSSQQQQLDPLALLARVAEGSTNAQSPNNNSNSNVAEETLHRLNHQPHSNTSTAAATVHNGALLLHKPLLQLPPYLNRHTSGEHTETAASFGDESATTNTSGDSNINNNNNHTATTMAEEQEEEPVQREREQQEAAALPTSGVLARRNKRRQQREAREASARTKSHKTHSEHDVETLRDVAPEEEEQVVASQATMGMNAAAMQPRYLMQQGGHMMPLGTVTAAAPYTMLTSHYGMQPFPQAYGSAMPFATAATDPSKFAYANAQAELQAAYVQQQQSAMMMAMAPMGAAGSGLQASMAGAMPSQVQEERNDGEVPWYESGIVDDDSEMDLTILEAEPFTLFL